MKISSWFSPNKSLRCEQARCTRTYNTSLGYFDVVECTIISQKDKQLSPMDGTPIYLDVKRKIACKTEKNERSCYWAHGRLTLYHGGYPNMHLWRVGTHRILAIYSGPGSYPLDAGFNQEEEEGPELPSNLMKYDDTKVSVFGDFEVCPLAPEKEATCNLRALNLQRTLCPKKSRYWEELWWLARLNVAARAADATREERSTCACRVR